jgi:hypothetical protein
MDFTSSRVTSPSRRLPNRGVIAEESNLLKWAGQYQTAAVRDRRLERIQPELIAMPNAPLETKITNVGTFLGTEEPLFPKLRVRDLRMFTGVQAELLESLTQERPPAEVGAYVVQRRPGRPLPDRLPANMSVSRSGSCMIIEGF